MILKIRLKRIGAKKKPFYKIVVTESTSPRDGKFIEVVGNFDPNNKAKGLVVNEEKILSWLVRGAHPTETVKKLLSSLGIITKFQEQKKSKKTA